MQPCDQRIRPQGGVEALEFIRGDQCAQRSCQCADHPQPLGLQVLGFVDQHDREACSDPPAHFGSLKQGAGGVALRIILVFSHGRHANSGR